MDKKEVIRTIGIIKLVFGIILSLVCIISTISIPSEMMNKNLEIGRSMEDLIGSEEVSNEARTTFLNESLTRSFLGLEHLILFFLLELIIFILSVMLILRGILSLQK